LGIGAGGQKTRMMGLPGRERSLMISSAFEIQCANVTDRQTDGHRATAKTALASRRAVMRTADGQRCELVRRTACVLVLY